MYPKALEKSLSEVRERSETLLTDRKSLQAFANPTPDTSKLIEDLTNKIDYCGKEERFQSNELKKGLKS